jgi:hypothetical protein
MTDVFWDITLYRQMFAGVSKERTASFLKTEDLA